MGQGRLTARHPLHENPEHHPSEREIRNLTESGEPELSVYYRHLAALPQRSDDENFRALLEQARRVSRGQYETGLYDHQQAFRLLWHHLDRSGYLH